MKSFAYNDTFNVDVEFKFESICLNATSTLVKIIITNDFYENVVYEIVGYISMLEIVSQQNNKYSLLFSDGDSYKKLKHHFSFVHENFESYSDYNFAFYDLVFDEETEMLSFYADFSDEEIVVSFKVEEAEVTEFSKPSK